MSSGSVIKSLCHCERNVLCEAKQSLVFGNGCIACTSTSPMAPLSAKVSIYSSSVFLVVAVPFPCDVFLLRSRLSTLARLWVYHHHRGRHTQDRQCWYESVRR